MTDKIRSILNAELLMLPYKFWDLEEAGKQKEQLESRFKVSARSLFSEQYKLDKMRKHKGDKPERHATEFKQLCALYFQQFLKSTGFEFELLEREILENKNTMERHLGKAWVSHLEFLIKIAKELGPAKSGPQGLLKRVI